MKTTDQLYINYKFHKAWLVPNGRVRFPIGDGQAVRAWRNAKRDLANGVKRKS